MEALALLRQVTGSDEYLDMDQRFMETSLQRVGTDGLSYFPSQGRPWAKSPGCWVDPVTGDQSQGQFCQLGFLGRLIASMTLYDRFDVKGPWFPTLEKMIDRINQLVIHRQHEAYIAMGGVAPGANIPSETPPPSGMWASHQAWLIQGLAQYSMVSGSKKALVLAEKLMAFVINSSGIFDQEGRFTGFDHFHHHTQCILAACDLARVTKKNALQRFCL